ncbi:MAG: molybdopterin-dependent oxidoreductase [Chloroflexi bacterium]|jgi:anaerobic selenocysteine-containing dehydrogenase|nr:molybdopterin-dependent oxidoreductase [Chloroflexota bacterium]MBT7081404.1 molybdopterin-dependent oxidoreductase [Chloroflexota bacterium]MBT7290452.1 molybdopterin-dependent oxidoreductase [Chloroflexota bacterium]
MIENGTVKSVCDICARGCGVLIDIKNGVPVKVYGDPNCSTNKGKLCIKGLASLDYLNHPDRLKTPLKRIGKRGEGKWQTFSWNEALDEIANAMLKAKEQQGAESVAFMHGAAKGYRDSYPARLANVFGTPNLAWQGHVCAVPRAMGAQFTYGTPLTCDFDHPPACVVVWGANYADTLHYNHNRLTGAAGKGAKIIVVDPQKIALAGKSAMWLRVRPGADLALALGMINVIINKSLYDKDFVDSTTIGFEQLKSHVQYYTPDKVSQITWMPADDIINAARMFATTKPACIILGNGIDQSINSFQTARAAAILNAITGNIDVPGGMIRPTPTPLVRRKGAELELWDKLPENAWNKRVSADLNLLPPVRYMAGQSIIKAIVDEKPYPIRCLYIQGCNPLLTYSNANQTYDALKKVDFLAVADMFMTPTAAMADVVLPAAGYLEYDSVEAAQPQQKVAQVGDCKSDYQMISELAVKLGLSEHFWSSEEECLDYLLKPSELTFADLRQMDKVPPKVQTKKPSDFPTPSGKIELYSGRLAQWGYDPIPAYHEQPETPYSDPELTKVYPLVLTSWKAAQYRHAGGRQIERLRKKHTDPVININTDTASKLGVSDGDWVYIENQRGKIKQKAALSSDIDPRVVIADYGWWFPEKGMSDLYGWAESNINVLTDNNPPYSPEMGSCNLRGMQCKVYKA